MAQLTEILPSIHKGPNFKPSTAKKIFFFRETENEVRNSGLHKEFKSVREVINEGKTKSLVFLNF
jgi:hypothetical protein